MNREKILKLWAESNNLYESVKEPDIIFSMRDVSVYMKNKHYNDSVCLAVSNFLIEFVIALFNEP